MKDHIRSLDSKGVSKSSTREENLDGSAVEQTLYEGGNQIIFFSPEALLGEETWRDPKECCSIGSKVVSLLQIHVYYID